MAIGSKAKILFFALLTILTTASGCDNSTNPMENTIPAEELLSAEDADGRFTIAIIPDTQQEVVVQAAIDGKHFENRNKWLADNREELDLRFVIHTGDVVNWGNEEPEQFEIASEAFIPLDEAGIPVALCLGNHDTAAVGVGGSAADPANTKTRVRDTVSFNKYFSTDRYNCVSFEYDKIDNAYQYFEAAGKKWLVMNLELWPRTEVIEWANKIIEARPDYNVIIATHSYLTADGKIYHKYDYGANSPQYLYDNLISKHENIKLVFSGHTGQSAVRKDYGEHGNRIVSVLGTFHSNLQNPVRLLEIDADAGTISGIIYSPIDDTEWTEHSFVIEDMIFVDPVE